jgi:hypothetical protein
MNASTIEIKDTTPITRGHLTVIATDLQGNKVPIICDDNLIVLNGKQIMAKLLTGESNLPVNTIKFGSGGVTEAGLRAPAITDTDLQQPIPNSAKALTSASVDVVSNEVRAKFNATLDYSELIGYTISEFALCSGVVMFSEKVHSGIPKTDQLKLDIIWEILF